MRMLELQSLPLDVQSYIATFLPRKSDVLSLQQTSHSLGESALTRIYHRVNINENIPLKLLTAMLGPDKPGLRHLHHLTLVLDPSIKS